MATLGRNRILKLVEDGSIKIEPFSKKQVGPASIDLHLGNTFRVFEKTRDVFHVREDANYKQLTRTVKVKGSSHFLIMPNELVQGITEENITFPSTLSGRIEGRSRFARVGLLIHLSSGFIQPGSTGRVVLEILNVSPLPLALHPGIAICQVIIEEAIAATSYRGAFSGQVAP
ncbi:MAG TPA: dCTP deaminase [Candidatus Dormibacteraeota bacterium]|jgi:dCTP deaminase|nr:dCTP deaminase [Candidatus Dormibacteraeota bacterium]